MWKLTETESKFANIIWNHEPMGSGELVKLCEQYLGWKKSTTYTMLKRLCERGIFQNEQSVVRSKISKEELKQRQSEAFVEASFGGSLPKFLATFMRKKKLTREQVEEIKQLIESYQEGGHNGKNFY